ncbi:hypothetical protein DQ04_02021150 [Trypanosoma grayi]|uniref:hypothetical protein n=1 Tax=Trypanosoma grayi TaxID=71804 RepID=UPI0004F44E87|nr:hypothetical protein DQ04_02021150 [Trypanosoma grayi]KEG12089.1 hypothetical protein DQ04_02021150 [Trypanosoma grayi]
MLDEHMEAIAAALSRVCVMRALDCTVLRSGVCGVVERNACGRRELWRVEREASLIAELREWQTTFVADWTRQKAEWRRSRSGAFREVEDDCRALACYLTRADFSSSPFAALERGRRLFAWASTDAFRTAAAAARDEALALAEEVCPAKTAEASSTRRLLLQSRRSWRVLFFVWTRSALARALPPSHSDCALLTAVVEEFLHEQRRDFRVKLLTAGMVPSA